MNLTTVHNIGFKGGRFVGETWYSDEEILSARKYRENPCWEEEFKDEFISEKKQKYTLEMWPWGSILNDLTLGLRMRSKLKQALENDFPIKLLRIRELMIKFNNEEISAESKKAEKLSAEAVRKKFDNAVLNILNTKFFKLLNSELEGKQVQIPTGIMLTKGSLQDREKFVKLIEEKSGCHFIEITHKKNEDETLYRIETELERAGERYNNSGERTILHIKNFHNMLKPQETSSSTISRLKNLMSDMGTSNSPLTILFHTNDTNGILDAFLVNNTRIPLKINLKELKLAQKSPKD